MSNMSRVITFATGKGGTGKTSCAANVAGLAAQAGWRTLLIDLDSQANLGHDLGFSEAEGADNGAHLVNTLVTGGTLTPVLAGVRPNLDVIPGGSKLDDLEDLVLGRQRRGGDGRILLREDLAGLAQEYDLTTIDPPPSPPPATVPPPPAAAREPHR